MINCVDDVSKRMSLYRLKANATETEFLWAMTSRRQHLIPLRPITLLGVDIIPSCCVELHGVNIDDNMSFSMQISKSAISDFFYLRQMKSIRRCLPADAARTLVNAFEVFEA